MSCRLIDDAGRMFILGECWSSEISASQRSLLGFQLLLLLQKTHKQRGGSEMPLTDLEVTRREAWVANQKNGAAARKCTLSHRDG